MPFCPNEVVPLQIDLARGERRDRFALAANPNGPLLCAGGPSEAGTGAVAWS